MSAEPPSRGHPFNDILDTPNFIFTPHVVWASDKAVRGLADQLVDNIEAFTQGAPCTVVQAPAVSSAPK